MGGRKGSSWSNGTAKEDPITALARCWMLTKNCPSACNSSTGSDGTKFHPGRAIWMALTQDAGVLGDLSSKHLWNMLHSFNERWFEKSLLLLTSSSSWDTPQGKVPLFTLVSGQKGVGLDQVNLVLQNAQGATATWKVSDKRDPLKIQRPLSTNYAKKC